MDSQTLKIALLSLCALSAGAQETSGPKQSMMQSPAAIKISVIEGEGGVNNVRSKMATPIVVEVRDDKDKPVAGAEVVFQLPAAGPGGAFNGWMRNQTTRTNEAGRASTSGLAPNDQEGRFNVKVTATAGTKTASVVVGQSNGTTGGPGGQKASSGKKNTWILIGVLAAGAIAGGAAAASRGGSAAPTTPVSITAGPISVGGPR